MTRPHRFLPLLALPLAAACTTWGYRGDVLAHPIPARRPLEVWSDGTRYDVHGNFTTIPGAHHPGQCGEQFDSDPETGDFNGVWTRSITGDFDFNPDATMPASGSWDDFIASFFAPNGESPTVTDKSYEFDYYVCGYHWRDAAYPYPNIVDSGFIGDC